MKIYVYEKFKYFTRFIKSNSTFQDANILIIPCYKLKDLIYDRSKRVIYCLSNAKSERVPRLLYFNNKIIIVPSYRYYEFLPFDINVLRYPYFMDQKAKINDIFYITENDELDLYNYYDFIKYHLDVYVRLLEYPDYSYRFILYLNSSVDTEHYYLEEAMLNGVVPITYLDVPGISVKIKSVKNLRYQTSEYTLAQFDFDSLQKSIINALRMNKAEYEKLQEDVIDYAKKHFRGEEKFVEILEDLEKMLN